MQKRKTTKRAKVSAARTRSGSLLAIFAVLIFAPLASADAPFHLMWDGILNSRPASTEVLAQVRTILSAPPETVDPARAKLMFDRLVDPSIDIEGSLQQINDMAARIKAMAGPNPSTATKLRALRTFIYVSGAWNDYRPFSYDMSDPLGQKRTNALLSHYLATRRGDCVSMPILFLVLADRLGLNVTLAEAPLHVFVKFTGDDGRTYNLETTSGAHPARDEWIRQQTPMTDAAIANGIYMRALSRRETLATMATIVLEDDVDAGRYDEAIAVADEILRAYPKNAQAILKQGTAYALQLHADFEMKYPTPRDIPPTLWPQYVALARKNQNAFERAEALGWREDTGAPVGSRN